MLSYISFSLLFLSAVSKRVHISSSDDISPRHTKSYELYASDRAYATSMSHMLPHLSPTPLGLSSDDLELFLPLSYHNSTHGKTGMSSQCKTRWKDMKKYWKSSYYLTYMSKSYGQPLFSIYKITKSDYVQEMAEFKTENLKGPKPGRACGSHFAKCAWTGVHKSHYSAQVTKCCNGDCGKAVKGSAKADLYDKGHQVPNRIMRDIYKADPQTFSFCNVGPQTNQLNEHKWEYLEAHIDCCAMGGNDKKRRKKKGKVESSSSEYMYVMAGPLPPFKESELECLGQKIPWPEQVDPKHMIAAGWWKIVYDGDSTYVWTFDNDFSGPYNEKSFTGEKGFDHIEAMTGFTFPSKLRDNFATEGQICPECTIR